MSPETVIGDAEDGRAEDGGASGSPAPGKGGRRGWLPGASAGRRRYAGKEKWAARKSRREDKSRARAMLLLVII